MISSVIVFLSAIMCLVVGSEEIPTAVDGETLFLTKYIKDNQLELAKTLSLVKHNELEWLTSYAGYFTVDETYNSNMFFWFFPGKNDSANAPVVLWLNGGPGASSLYGLLKENGPFFINSENKLEPRKYSWHVDHNILYIDNPVGAGFSFTDDEDGYATNQIQVGANLLAAVKQFFSLFPELKRNRFYITGESYAGKYLPALGIAILRSNNRHSESEQINLRGIAIGNGFIDPLHQVDYGDYLYQLGLVDDNGRRLFDDYQKRTTDCIRRRDFEGAYQYLNEMIIRGVAGSLLYNLTGFDSVYNFLEPNDESYEVVANVFKQEDMKTAIHVGNRSFQMPNLVLSNLIPDIMDSVGEWVAELLDHYQVYLYSGQLDIIIPYPSSVRFLKSLNFNASDEYKTTGRHIWEDGNELIGYVKKAGSLTEVLIRNAGHQVPADQPKWMLKMLKKMTYETGFDFS